MAGLIPQLFYSHAEERDRRAGGKADDMVAEPGEDRVVLAHADQHESAGPSGSGRITSREEAFRRLDEAADYLMRTEPHSPCPYLVKRAVAWGNMPLTVLLQELVRGEGDLQELYGLLGMHTHPRPPGESK